MNAVHLDAPIMFESRRRFWLRDYIIRVLQPHQVSANCVVDTCDTQPEGHIDVSADATVRDLLTAYTQVSEHEAKKVPAPPDPSDLPPTESP